MIGVQFFADLLAQRNGAEVRKLRRRCFESALRAETLNSLFDLAPSISTPLFVCFIEGNRSYK